MELGTQNVNIRNIDSSPLLLVFASFAVFVLHSIHRPIPFLTFGVQACRMHLRVAFDPFQALQCNVVVFVFRH